MAAGAADELRFLASAMRRAGDRATLAELRRELKRAAWPAAAAAQRSILGMPARQPGGTLRQGIADTVKVTASLGASTVRVRVSASGPERWPGAAAALEEGRWRHPVHGHRDRWVTQVSRRPGWFGHAVAGHQDEFDRAVDAVTDGIERRLAGEP
jgi:hypothetical protein